MPDRNSFPRVLTLLIVCMAMSATAKAQNGQSGAPVHGPIIDSVIIQNVNIFDDKEARGNFLFRLMNGIHVVTRPWVVRRELLFKEDEPYDSASVEETMRNLRAMEIFRDVDVDTVRVGDQMHLYVRAKDGWTTAFQIEGRTTAGDFTWAVGVREKNLLGTATLARWKYRRLPDRNTLTFEVKQDRLIANKIAGNVKWSFETDGNRGEWLIGKPFRSVSERFALEFQGFLLDTRRLQFRDGVLADSTTQRQFLQRVRTAYATSASPAGYFRLGGEFQVRREERLVRLDGGLASRPDSLTAAVGVFAELFRTNFRVTQHYIAFAQDVDVDLSTRIRGSLWLAPAIWGYDRTGLGPGIDFQTGAGAGALFGKLNIEAHGLFTSQNGRVVMDSGRVTVKTTIVSQHLPRQATVLHAEVGAMKGTPKGDEFDLGFGIGPRGFGIHSFTGTRQAWMTAEHRVFLIDELFKLVGVGVAGFFDYGGAWFPDQRARAGGNVGFGLRLSSTRSGRPTVGRFDWAWRFGDGFPPGNRWAFSVGQSVPF